MNQTWESSAPQPQRVECPASREPAVRRGILTAMLLGFGAWCSIDMNKYQAPADWTIKNINEIAAYLLNHWGPYVMIPAGTALLIWTALGLRKKLLADEEGIGFAGRKRILWAQVDRLDASKLASKGLAVLHAGGRRLVLDSYFLQNFHELMALVEHRVPPDKQILK